MIEMQAASDKTFHLKWNNHLQNLSQLFTTIYSSSALADVTLACRDGTLRAHKLVLSACSPYFEQIFKDNPCKHPVVILKGIPYSEINLLVEFMYKGSVDVQELDLQSLMHTASELEIRGLAYEVRANAAQLLNVNLEYPAFSPPAVTVASTAPYDGTPRTMPRADMERLKQIHMYQQSMIREAELAKRKRREEATPANTTNAVKSILAAAAKELADGTRERTTSCVQTEDGETTTVKTEMFHAEEETWSKPKKRVSIVTPEEERRNKRKMQYVVKQSPQHEGDDGLSKLRISAVTGGDAKPETPMSSSGSIKVVNISALQQPGPPADPLSDDEDSMLLQERSHHNVSMEEEDSCSSESASESMHDNSRDSRPHVCDICDIRFQRASHLSRHRLTHTGERPFTCGGCGKSFARSDKLRVHTKICERDDPTVDMAEDGKVDSSSEVMSGTVRITHRDSRQLMFTPSGDVMLAPRAAALPTTQPTSLQSPDTVNMDTSKMEETPMKRGRGRPKKPVPDIPKVKKRRGRPPKALTGTVPTPRKKLMKSKSVIKEKFIKKENTLTLLHPTLKRQSLLNALEAVSKCVRKRKYNRSSKLMTLKKGIVKQSKAGDRARKCIRTNSELDMMMGLGNGVSPLPVLGAGVSGLGVESAGAVNTVPMQQHITPSGQQLIVKRKRGRPPKNFFQPLSGVRLPESFYEGNFAANFKTYGQPKENYNATNLPFGDFSYLTEMINYPGGIYQHAFHNVTTVDPEQDVDVDSTPNPNTAPARNRSIDSHNRTPDGTEEDGSHARRDRTIDLSSSSSDDGTEDSRADNTLEGDDNVPAAICETEIMTVGDCQILKLPPSGEEPPKPQEASASENGKLSITAITSIGDCTIRPVDADAHQ